MTGAATIVIVRDDLSIAGSDEESSDSRAAADIERSFFTLVYDQRPDVIVLDTRGPRQNGITAIRKIHEKTEIPILAICEANDSLQRQYRIVGAAECLPAPFDIVGFNAAVQEIIQLTRQTAPRVAQQLRGFYSEGMTFLPHRNSLGWNGTAAKLTTAENNLLNHLMQRPGIVCSRVEIAEVLYGPYRPTSDRAIDVVVNRLRKKLCAVRGSAAGNLIKTEFRLGYIFVGEVAAAPGRGHMEQVAE